MSVSKFLEEKWRKGFRFFDIDKDGYLTEKDLEYLANFISDYTNATETERTKTREEWVKWFAILQPSPWDDAITEDVLVARNADLVINDIEKLKSFDFGTYSTLFDNIDLDNDGRISLEELNIYYRGHGVKDEQFVRLVFQKLDTNGHGYLERDEFVKAGVDYWSNADETVGCSFMYDPPTQGDHSTK